MPAITRTLVLLLGSLTAFSPLTIDMYLPALPNLASAYGGSMADVQLTLSAYFIGLAIGQPLYGPLSDAYGRKGPLLVGVTLYTLTSIGCAFAPNIESMIALRLIQALGGCAGMVIARAVVRDLVSGQEAARLFSTLMLVMGVAPVLAPIAGNTILQWYNWQAIFLALAAFGLACWLGAAFSLPETLPAALRRPTGFGAAFRSFGTLLRDRRFVGYATAGGFAFSTMFIYVTASAQVFMGIYGLSPTAFAWLFGSNAAGMIAASQLNRRLLRRFSFYTILRHALGLHAAAAIAFFIAAAAHAPLAVLCVPLWITITSLGLVSPNGSAAALSGDPRLVGSASSLMGTVPFVVGAAGGAFVGLLPQNTPISMAAVMAFCAMVAWGGHRMLIVRTRLDGPMTL